MYKGKFPFQNHHTPLLIPLIYDPLDTTFYPFPPTNDRQVPPTMKALLSHLQSHSGRSFKISKFPNCFGGGSVLAIHCWNWTFWSTVCCSFGEGIWSHQKINPHNDWTMIAQWFQSVIWKSIPIKHANWLHQSLVKESLVKQPTS